MNRKRIAFFCCAALVASGIGLNIQNAIENYGIGENSLSLVATGGSGSSGSCVESVSFASCTSTWNTEAVEQVVTRCGRFAGKWIIKGVKYLKGAGGAIGVVSGVITLGEFAWTHWGPQLSHYEWQEYSEGTGNYTWVTLPDGDRLVQVEIMRVYEHCDEIDESGDSQCDPARDHDRTLRYIP